MSSSGGVFPGSAAGPDHGPSPFGAAPACSECRMVQESEHRIANHLSLLAGVVRLRAIDLARQSGPPAPEAIQLLLENIRAQISAIGRLHRALAQGGPDESTGLSDQLHEVCAPLISVLGGRIDFVEDVSGDCRITPAQVLPLSQIVAELIMNSVKHAYPAGGAGRISLQGRQAADGTVTVDVADDGPGFPDALDAGFTGGLGFGLIRALGRQLGASIEFQPANPGLRCRITLPSQSALER